MTHATCHTPSPGKNSFTPNRMKVWKEPAGTTFVRELTDKFPARELTGKFFTRELTGKFIGQLMGMPSQQAQVGKRRRSSSRRRNRSRSRSRNTSRKESQTQQLTPTVINTNTKKCQQQRHQHQYHHHKHSLQYFVANQQISKKNRRQDSLQGGEG